MVGMTSSQLKRIMKTKGRAGDDDVLGISREEFVKIAKSGKNFSDVVKAFKKRGLTEFATGWGARIIGRAGKQMRGVI